LQGKWCRRRESNSKNTIFQHGDGVGLLATSFYQSPTCKRSGVHSRPQESARIDPSRGNIVATHSLTGHTPSEAWQISVEAEGLRGSAGRLIFRRRGTNRPERRASYHRHAHTARGYQPSGSATARMLDEATRYRNCQLGAQSTPLPASRSRTSTSRGGVLDVELDRSTRLRVPPAVGSGGPRRPRPRWPFRVDRGSGLGLGLPSVAGTPKALAALQVRHVPSGTAWPSRIIGSSR
jgi:hypothetical protein